VEPIRIGLCGLGTVGQGVIALLKRNEASIERQAGRPIRLTRVASRTAKPLVELGSATFGTDIFELARDPEVDIVVELIGGDSASAELFGEAIRQRKHFVTANKAMIAMYGDELLLQAYAAGIGVGFEAAVGGGIPIIKTVREALAANSINWIAGIINGTSNFILSAMAGKGASFDDALTEAQALGYAEADPTFDVEGVDAAHKIAILAALAFDTSISFPSVYTEGISALTAEDIDYAARLGYRVKHLGIARRSQQGIETRVHPVLIPEGRLLAKVDGVMNAIVVNTDAIGSSLYYGPGAGALPTASSVLADVIDIARNRGMRAVGIPDNGGRLGIADIETAYYLRIPAVDQPGVLAQVAQILSQHAISIEAVIQREQAIRMTGATSWVPVVILTHRVRESAMNQALETIQALPEVVGQIARIRVEPLDEHA
jgi:homoserine dehydrogenase